MTIAVGGIYAIFIEGARNAAWTRVVPCVLDDFPQNVILWINYLRFSSIWIRRVERILHRRCRPSVVLAQAVEGHRSPEGLKWPVRNTLRLSSYVCEDASAGTKSNVRSDGLVVLFAES